LQEQGAGSREQGEGRFARAGSREQGAERGEKIIDS